MPDRRHGHETLPRKDIGQRFNFGMPQVRRKSLGRADPLVVS